MSNYDPERVAFESFITASERFADGSDDPRRFLERCLARIEACEGGIKAFAHLDTDNARLAADMAARRWQAGEPLSPLDGIPVGIKDCFDVAGWPTRMNSPVFDGAATALSDAAHVASLRRAGAVILGKTTTTEWTMAAAPPTRNPWDMGRTPGGSSAGSAAAIAAGMLPLATGSQVRGSGIRPASICGVLAYKPTFGALNRHGGIDPNPSLNHLVLFGAALREIWQAAIAIASDVGADPGHLAFSGSGPLPGARRPLRLARQYTIGWEKTDPESQKAFANWLAMLADRGIEVLEPDTSDQLREYETATRNTQQWFFDLFREIIWPLRELHERYPDSFSDVMKGHIERASRVTLAQYEHALARRAELRQMHRRLAGQVDGFVTLGHIGPGQEGFPEVGTPWYNDASSAIGAPSMNLPVLSINALPLGVQLMGFEHRDAELFATAGWLIERR